MCLDLSEPAQQELALDLIRDPHTVFVHLSPPCGTASRAREKPLPQHLLQRGFSAPAPLRSDEFPLGLPSLKGQDAVRVHKANSIYQFCFQALLLCISLGVIVTCENPARSLFWNVLETWDTGCQLHALEEVSFHACCHGGGAIRAPNFCAPRKSLQASMPNVTRVTSICPGAS